ncbi:winged helix DNA-binding protein [Spongiibacter nanhainus]|uniref:Winged helix DNA-binding protein n=1 Tax=Spongiibacter nanhainus TaxID=2794344 RepID=A0A7T4R3B7_9GAMM|nr:winged helix DNA-binding protein [Spongiibacter nanhainus]QQD19547.1 winged helix DNA-binding protein [Spongiibacter nanhainus]
MKNSWKKPTDVPATQDNAPAMFLDYFYPIHFSIGMKIEAGLMECGRLDRHQTVIMWILRSELQRTEKTAIHRKDVVRLMTNWYDITSSSVSKALRALSREPLGYITLSEDPNSGREKLIEMTDAGRQHCDEMIASACKVIRRITDHFSKEENQMGIYMFMRMDDEFSAYRDDDNK